MDKQLEMVQDILDGAAEYSLTAEVVLSAFMALKANPSLTPLHALLIGSNEWDVIIKQRKAQPVEEPIRVYTATERAVIEKAQALVDSSNTFLFH